MTDCPRPLAGVRLVRLPVDPEQEAETRARQLAALEGLPRVDLTLSFCDFDETGRCTAHEDCHLPLKPEP